MSARVVALVQARTGSKRLPGKVLMEVGGIPIVTRVLTRARMAESVQDVVLATTDRPRDTPLAELAAELGIACHRGSEENVLHRMREAAELSEADVVVRLTADCPLLDPDVVDAVVRTLLRDDAPCDYASNVIRRTYPRGLDVEALFVDVLMRIDRLAHSPEAREHVTWFAYRERPELFVLRSVELGEDWSHIEWAVDDVDDLERVRTLCALHERHRSTVPWRELLVNDPT